MRRLAFAIHDLHPWGGHDRSTLEIARRLSHRWPVDVYAFTLEDPRGLASWGDVRFHRVRPGVEHPVLAKISLYHAATLPLLGLAPALAGRERPLVHATGTCSLVSDVVQVQFVSAAWKKRRRELPPGLCAAPFARGASEPRAWLRQGYERFMLEYSAALEHRVYSRDKSYIAIARSVALELEEHFGLRERVHVVHHGVDGEAFAPVTRAGAGERAATRRELGFGESDVVFAFVGAYERKGLAAAIDALALLPREARARARILAVGGGAAAGFARRAAEAGVGERVTFLQHQKEVARFYRASDAFVLPTLYEPFGLVILEAMACGLAPVVSRLAGASELIVPGESGELVEDPTDPAGIAARMERLVLDDALRARMGAAARAVAEARSWDRVADEYAAILQPLLARQGGSG